MQLFDLYLKLNTYFLQQLNESAKWFLKLETNEKAEGGVGVRWGLVITVIAAQLQDTETNYHPSVNCSFSWPPLAPLLSVGFLIIR